MEPRGWQRCPIFQTGQLRLGNVWSLAQSHAAWSIGTPSLGSFVVLPCHSAAPPLDRPEIRTQRSALPSFSCLSPLQVPLCPGTLKVSPPLPPRNLQRFPKTLLASLCRVPGQLSRDIPTRPFRFPASSCLLELLFLFLLAQGLSGAVHTYLVSTYYAPDTVGPTPWKTQGG